MASAAGGPARLRFDSVPQPPSPQAVIEAREAGRVGADAHGTGHLSRERGHEAGEKIKRGGEPFL